jgi:hypothetical protein
MLTSVVLSVGRDRGISSRVDDQDESKGSREDRTEEDGIYSGMRGAIVIISRG